MHALISVEMEKSPFFMLDINSWTWLASLWLFDSRRGKKWSLFLLAQAQLHMNYSQSSLGMQQSFVALSCIVQLLALAVTLL